MAGVELPSARTRHETPRRRRGLLHSGVPKLLATSACAAAVVGIAAPAHAEPTDPYVYLASATDDTFIRALDGLKIEHPSDTEAVNIARGACAYIESGHRIRDAVDGVRNSYPGLPLLKSAHFVAVARALYCPNSSDW